MQDIDLLIAIAEIAGVFVGFGALISVTKGSEVNSSQLGLVRAVVTIGLTVVVAALIPVALNRYGISGHDLWFLCSLIFLIVVWAVNIYSVRTPEIRKMAVSQARANPVTSVFFWLLLEIPMQIPLILVLLNVNPQLDPAFYITTLVLNLFQAVFVLAQFVYSQQST